MCTIHLSNDMEAANQDLIRKAAEVQSAKIVQPIYEYMKSYGLDRELTFLYKGDIRDVDIYSPYFEAGIQEKADDFERIVFLLEKHGVAVPSHIQSMQLAIRAQSDLRKVVSQFENWLVGHMSYLDLEGLEIETIFYAAHTGFLIKFAGLDPIKKVVDDLPAINDIKVPVLDIKPKTERKPSTKKPLKAKARKHSQIRSADEWKKQSAGYLWAQEQLKLGRPRNEIIYEFNLRHKKDPENYSSREGKPLSAAILSHWAKESGKR